MSAAFTVRERIAYALFESGNERLNTPERDWLACADDYRKDADRVIAALDDAKLYVCEMCNLLGPMSAFQDECAPGYTHGRFLKVLGIKRAP